MTDERELTDDEYQRKLQEDFLKSPVAAQIDYFLENPEAGTRVTRGRPVREN